MRNCYGIVVAVRNCWELTPGCRKLYITTAISNAVLVIDPRFRYIYFVAKTLFWLFEVKNKNPETRFSL